MEKGEYMERALSPVTRKHMMVTIADIAGHDTPGRVELWPCTSISLSPLPCIVGVIYRMIQGWPLVL